MSRSARVALIAALSAGAVGCKQDRTQEHASYISARTAIAGSAARAGGDGRCVEEPACSTALSALEAIPADSPDHGEAVALLGTVRDARARRPLGQEAAPVPQARPVEAAALPPPPAAALAGAEDALAAAPPPPAEKKKKKNYRDPDDDDDWGLTVVGATDLGGGTDYAETPSGDTGWSQPLNRPSPQAQLSCADIQARIQARSNELDAELSRLARIRERKEDETRRGIPTVLSANDKNSFDLSAVTKDLSSLESDGTKSEGKFTDPEMSRLRDQLSNCKP